MPSKKNRDYTGLVRTPPSMAWLIRERSKLQGRIDRIGKQLEALPRELVTLRAQLDALDAVFPLHQVSVAPGDIEGRKPKAASIGPYGALTRHILSELRSAEGVPIFAMEIALSYAREYKVDIAKVGRARLNRSVGKRLQALLKEGVVQRHHAAETSDLGSWSLQLGGFDQGQRKAA